MNADVVWTDLQLSEIVGQLADEGYFVADTDPIRTGWRYNPAPFL